MFKIQTSIKQEQQKKPCFFHGKREKEKIYPTTNLHVDNHDDVDDDKRHVFVVVMIIIVSDKKKKKKR